MRYWRGIQAVMRLHFVLGPRSHDQIELQNRDRKSDLRESIGHFPLDTHEAAAVWSIPPDELGSSMEVCKNWNTQVRLQHSLKPLRAHQDRNTHNEKRPETSQSTRRQEYAQREGAMQTIVVKMSLRGRDRPELVPLTAGVLQSHHRLHKEADDDSCLAPGIRKKTSFPARPLELPQVTNLDIQSGTDIHPNNKCG